MGLSKSRISDHGWYEPAPKTTSWYAWSIGCCMFVWVILWIQWSIPAQVALSGGIYLSLLPVVYGSKKREVIGWSMLSALILISFLAAEAALFEVTLNGFEPHIRLRDETGLVRFTVTSSILLLLPLGTLGMAIYMRSKDLNFRLCTFHRNRTGAITSRS